MSEINLFLYAGAFSYLWFSLIPQLQLTQGFALNNISIKYLQFSPFSAFGWGVSLGAILLLAHIFSNTPPSTIIPHLVNAGKSKGGDICGPLAPSSF